MTDQDLDQLRREKWHFNGATPAHAGRCPPLHRDVGFCLMYPMRKPLLAPTFIGAWTGIGQAFANASKHAYADPRAREATEIMVRLLRNHDAYEANQFEENNAFLVAGSIFPYFYALVESAIPNKTPQPKPRSEYSPAGLRCLRAHSRAGPISKQKMREDLGGSISFVALDHDSANSGRSCASPVWITSPKRGRLLGRALPLGAGCGARRHRIVGRKKRLSALLSKYLDCVVAADQQEVESFFPIPSLDETLRARLCYALGPPVGPRTRATRGCPLPGSLDQQSLLCVHADFRPQDGVGGAVAPGGVVVPVEWSVQADAGGSCASAARAPPACPATGFPEYGASWFVGGDADGPGVLHHDPRREHHRLRGDGDADRRDHQQRDDAPEPVPAGDRGAGR